MKNLKIYKYLSILLCLLMFLSITINAFSKEPLYGNGVNLVLDNTNYNELPSKFRTTNNLESLDSTTLNLTGLKDLNISGSEQFSEMNLPLLVKSMNTNLPIIDYDLRQESHGFINGIPISFENEKNDANKGLSNDEVLKKEREQLSSLTIGVPICFYNDDKKCITPKTVMDEKTLATNNKLKYFRIFATDEELPDSSTIDDFVASINNLSGNYFLYFHCKEGIGRTTSFMIFYDMMKNYKNVSSSDIINRQIKLAPFDDEDIRLLTSKERISLFNSFYNYCTENGDNFKVKYSDYISKNK